MDYLYVMYDERFYKIGCSDKPESRLKQVKTSNPTVKILLSFQTDSAEVLEHSLHNKFEIKNIGGEWFTLNDADIEWIKTLDNPEIRKQWIIVHNTYCQNWNSTNKILNIAIKELDLFISLIQEDKQCKRFIEIEKSKNNTIKLLEDKLQTLKTNISNYPNI